MLSYIFRRSSVFALTVLLFSATELSFFAAEKNESGARWFKGNLHTHSLWSDGDDFPEMIADWYKTHGYDFLAFSDHNNVQHESNQKWAGITNDNRQTAFKKYTARFGKDWIEQKQEDGHTAVRLKTFEEYRSKFDEPGKFLVVRGEEMSDRWMNAPIHIGAINVKEFVQPLGGSNVVDVMNNNFDAVYAQRKKTGQPMFAHVNHPNWQWGLTAEEMAQVRQEKFFEVYNGHPGVHNLGNETHASTDRVWDIVLTKRLTELKLPVVYGVGTDDSHIYHVFGPLKNNPGRGWIMVQAKSLSAENLVKAMEAGDFYASSGVTLKNVSRSKKTYEVEVDPEPGVSYVIQFIGTRKGFDTTSEPYRAASGTPLRVTQKYSNDVGAVLAEEQGTKAVYKMKGDEIYVRAKVVSSKKRVDPNTPELVKVKKDYGMSEKYTPASEFECAWAQPVVGKAAKK